MAFPPRRRLSLELSLAMGILAGGGVVLIAWAIASWSGVQSVWLWLLLAVGGVLLLVLWLPRRILRPLNSLTNVLEAARRRDLAIRARTDRPGVLGELGSEINRFADSLQAQGIARTQSDALLAKLMQEIDLPIFTFDDDARLAAANPAAYRLCGTDLEVGVSAKALGLTGLLDRNVEETVQLSLGGGAGRFLVRRRRFRIGGRGHVLLVLAEAGGALGAERREAWQSLVRVLGHEINNSLAPIKSIAHVLMSSHKDMDGESLHDSLELIAGRAESLERFVGRYAALARMPTPRPREIDVGDLIRRAAGLEPRRKIDCEGPEIYWVADPDLLEQALINLLKNAVDAVDGGQGEVRALWGEESSGLLIEVLDNGPGPPESENLFVPFFTTKPDGHGVGLLLARRVAELHGGRLTLSARQDRQGAAARLWLPQASI
jgi:two-component system, NtrC family, nitrogen regulation sensor histidine kinase NtrY